MDTADNSSDGLSSTQTEMNPSAGQTSERTEDLTGHHAVTPSEISLRGPLALEAYNKALTEGMTCVKTVPIMLIGHNRSGKTSLKHSLLGKPFIPDEYSTVGIDVDPSYFKVSSEIWKAGENNQATSDIEATSFEHHAARLVAEEFKDEKKDTNAVEAMSFEHYTAHSSLLGEKEMYSTLWDFSGQSLYYATHPIFLTPRAMYLLVCDLSRDPHKKAEPIDTKTYLDHLNFWMTSIASLTCQDEGHNIPCVFLVCTHADKPYGGANPVALAREVFGYLQTKPYRNLLYKDVFVVDNTKSGTKSESLEIIRLRENVLAVAKELPQMKEFIPIKWLLYEKALQGMAKEGEKWISLEMAKQIASEECKIDDHQEFSSLLNFLHDRRILIHFDDTPVLNNLVVLDPQWLVDVFRRVITVGPYDPEEREFKKMRYRLETTGILEEKLLEHVWGPLLDQRETSESLLAIMEKFSLLCPWPSLDASGGKQYLVPSMLMSHAPQDVIKLVDSAQIPSLFFKFESGNVPLGLFSRLIVQFFQWGQDEFWSTKNTPDLYHNYARFYTSANDDCSVILQCHSSSIEVTVHRADLSADLAEGLRANTHSGEFAVFYARIVRRQLGLMLDEMRKKFHWLKNMRYEEGFICSACCQGGVVNYCNTHHKQGCEQEECLHFWSESDLRSSNQFVLCHRDAFALSNRVLVMQFTPWIDLGEQLKLDERDGRRLAPVEMVVPSEINLRGPLALEAYNKALTEGKACVKRVPIMLIGQDHSGKTSLKNSLMGKPFNKDEDSTLGIDVDPSYFKVSSEIWRPEENDQATNDIEATSFEHRAARLVADELKEEKRVTKSVRSENIEFKNDSSLDVSSSSTNNAAELPVESAPSSESSRDATESIHTSKDPNVDVRERVPETSSDPTQRREEHSTLRKIPEEVAILIKKLIKEVEKVPNEEEIYSLLWDFGGQSVYYTTHPLFITTGAMYLLIYDLSRDPYALAVPVVKQGKYQEILDNHGAKSNLDYLNFWMTSTASFASQDEDQHVRLGRVQVNTPPVFLVCTHADKPYGGANPLVLARKVLGFLQTKPYRNQLYNDVFVVDNTKSGTESECSEVIRLRENVIAVAKELPQMKEPIPIKWLKYEKALQRTAKEGHKWISLETAKQIASEVCQIGDDKELSTLLDFLHDQRILIHFDDTTVLNNLVVLDPQWLVDVFKKVITVKPCHQQEKEFEELWWRLECKGILEQKLLEHVWGPLFDQQETSASLIEIMEKFSLLCPWPSSDVSCGKQYLVPSMLMSHPPQDIIDLVVSAQIPSFFLKFESGQVPPGLFPRLVLQFFQWGQGEFWSAENPQLYHSFARFYTSKDEDCSVILLCHSSSIEVVVHRGNLSADLTECFQSKLNISANTHYDAFEVACARAVRRQLGLMLECMRKEFCWLKNMTYEVCVMCPVCCQGGLLNYCCTHHKQGCEQEECLHFWTESDFRSSKQFVRCRKCATAQSDKVYVKLSAPWIETSDAQLTIDTIDESLLVPDEGSDEKLLALPSKDLESLLSQPCDSKEVVLQLKDCLPLDQASLEQPDPGTKRLIRCLAMKAKQSNRLDVFDHLREITPAGTTGPRLRECLDIRRIPFHQMRALTVRLSGGDEWKIVAEELGLNSDEIRYLDNRTQNPCEALLAYIAQHCYRSVGYLYSILNKCKLPLVADIL